MAFSKEARAVVETPRVGLEDWNRYRQKAATLGGDLAFPNRSASLAIENYSPDKYLLTHCTIIASVDVDEMQVDTGENIVTADGNKINRPHADYLIKPDCSKYINQNGDAWERKLLMATYKTFVGAENYVEHVQIPELSKGKIIDAVARDLGDTVYIDILVATDRKHKDLVARIESGELNTLSMGCTISYSICTKCGNLAVDEPQLCHHVKYEKGNKFVGPDGQIRVVAELCGHHTDPESVKFIEASWVGNPAFKGAVMRSILNLNSPKTKEPTKYEQDHLQQLIHEAHVNASTPPDWTEFLKTASAEIQREVHKAVRLAFMDDEDEDEEEEVEEEDTSLIDDVAEEIKEKIRKRILDDMRDELKKEDGKGVNPEAEIHPNDTIHKSYQVFASRYAGELKGQTKPIFQVLHLLGRGSQKFAAHKTRFSNKDILTAMYLYDRDGKGNTLEPDLYMCLSKVGSTSGYPSIKHFLRTCRKTLRRKMTSAEARTLIERAKFLN